MNAEPTIAGTAGVCFNAFQQCLEKSAFISPREMSRVEDQFARFSLWTANIGVFASGRASLDHRLREAQEVHEVITGLLEVLDDKTKDCTSFLKSFIKPEGDDASEIDQGKLDKHIQGLATQITLLHRLSNTIRKASSETQNAKAANTFKILDDEGNDVEPLLEIIFANYVRDKFRSIDEKILQRLVRAMITRRKRVLYKRSRFGNLALRVKETKPRPKVQAPQTQPLQAPATQELQQVESKDDTGTNYRSQAGVSATTLAADKFKKASAPSVISGTKTVAFDNHEDLPFPPPPLGRVRRKFKKLKRMLEEQHKSNPDSISVNSRAAGEVDDLEFRLSRMLNECWDQCLRAVGEVTCPFCFYAISALDISEDNKWRSHVRNDLDAYICLFEQCNDQDKLFGHSEEWLRHMREHALRWPCNSKSHGNIIFESRDEYINHLREAHKNTFSDPQLRVLADRNARTIGPLFKSCPFCGFDDTSSGTKMEEHIVGHLRFLALKSLPPYEDERSESSDAESTHESTSSRVSKPRKRSTIENDPEKEVKMNFVDNGSIVLLDPGDESVVEPVLTSQYIPRRRNMEWGFVTEVFDEMVNVNQDAVLQHIATKQVHQYLSGPGSQSEALASDSYSSTLRTEYGSSTVNNGIVVTENAVSMSVLQDRQLSTESTESYQGPKVQLHTAYPGNTGTPSSPVPQANKPVSFKTHIDQKNSKEWLDEFISNLSDDWGDKYHDDLEYYRVDEVPSELNTSKKSDDAQFSSYGSDVGGDEYHEEEDDDQVDEVPPVLNTSRFAPAAPDSRTVPGTNQDERSSDKGKHRIIEVTTEGPSGSQFLSVSGTGTERTSGSRIHTLSRPSESRSLRSLSEGLVPPQDYWNAPYQIHGGKDQKDDEEVISPVPIIDTDNRRSWFKMTPEELRNEPSSENSSEIVDLVAVSTEPERRRDAHSLGARPIEKMSLRKGNKDKKLAVERGEVNRISETPLTGEVPDVVPRQCVAGNSILVNTDASSQQHVLPNSDDSLLDDMIRRLLASPTSFSKALCLSDMEITTLCMASRELFLSQPVLLELKAPVKIVGDIHGQYTDLLRMFELSGYPPNVNYLFLGDYVDRGKSGLETILLLLCYKMKYPENFFLLRGNHECANVTRVYGFYDECKRRCSVKIWKAFVDVFNCLPVAAIVSDKIFCVHGGLSPSLGHLNDIRAILRPTDIPDYGLTNDLLWSDPARIMDQDWEPNERGVSYTFGKNVIQEFLTKFDFDLVCRAHMVVEDGYEFYEDRLLVTIFTAPNYCGEFDNWGAIMSVSEDLLCSFELLKPLSVEAKPLKAAKSLTANLLDRWKKWTAPSEK